MTIQKTILKSDIAPNPAIMIGRHRRYLIRWSDVVRMMPPLPNHRFNLLFVTFQDEPIELSPEDVELIEEVVSALYRPMYFIPPVSRDESINHLPAVRLSDRDTNKGTPAGCEAEDGGKSDVANELQGAAVDPRGNVEEVASDFTLADGAEIPAHLRSDCRAS